MSAQLWADIGFGRGYVPRVLYSETPSSKLYVAGNFISINSSSFSGIVTFDNVNGWQKLGNQLPDVYSILKFNNEIYAGSYNGVFKLNGMQWDTIGKIASGSINILYGYNNELYAGGIYNKIDTVASGGLAKWDGLTWKRVGNYKNVCSGQLYSLIEFNNELYACGQLTDSNGTPMSITKYSGNTWNRITNNFNGSIDEISTSVIFNNELYVAGTFGKCYGSVFNFISKYDGNAWSDVGFNGLTGITSSSNGQVHALKVINNKLYAVGVFSYADNIPAQYLASWDGIKWCGYNYGANFDNVITQIAEANDSIYISGGFKKFNTDSIFSVAKWIGGTFVDTCGYPSYTSVNELSSLSDVRIYPNPATSVLNISDEQNDLQGSTIEISNSIGQTVLSLAYNTTIDISSLPPGYYLIRIRGAHLNHTAKFIKE